MLIQQSSIFTPYLDIDQQILPGDKTVQFSYNKNYKYLKNAELG